MNTLLGLRPISELAVGDLVLSFDVARRRLVERKISRVFRHGPQKFGALLGTSLTGVTPNHPVFDAGRGSFLEAGKLTHEWEALLLAEGAIKTARGEGYRLSADAPEPVFNLSIAETETYFAEGVLVHNKSYDEPQGCGIDDYTPDCGVTYGEYLGWDQYQVRSEEAVCEGTGIGGAGGALLPPEINCAQPQRDAYLRVLAGDEGERRCSDSQLRVEPMGPVRVSVYEMNSTCDLSGEPLSSVAVDVPTSVPLPSGDRNFWVHLEPLDETPLVVDVRLW